MSDITLLSILKFICSFVFVIVSTAFIVHVLNNPSSLPPDEPVSISEVVNNDVYEFVDSDTGVHYLIFNHKAGYAGMGGITPRLNSDGSIMID